MGRWGAGSAWVGGVLVVVGGMLVVVGGVLVVGRWGALLWSWFIEDLMKLAPFCQG